MRKLTRLSIRNILADATQPRKTFDPDDLLALGENLLKYGQQVPVIVYGTGEAKTLVDGERRWRAAQLKNIPELDAIVLDALPTESELPLLRMSVEAHKSGLSALERSDLLHKIKSENNWSVSELAARLQMKQPLCSKLLALQRLCPDARKLLEAGGDMDKAYVISQAPDAAGQLELIKQAGDLTRAQLRQKAHSNGQPVELKATSARFLLPSGLSIMVKGRQITLGGAIAALLEAIKELKLAQAQRLDITTAARVLRDKATACQKGGAA